jgi:catechol 2,3-dioxygenase-like lactoylglutathione lyase family enzyme
MGLELDLVGIVVHDMRASLEFYRRLGLDIPEGAQEEPHAEATAPSGLRVAWDTVELIPFRSIDVIEHPPPPLPTMCSR